MASSGGSGGDVPQGYWKALFEFAANVGASDPVNQTPSAARQMPEEDRRWLQEALSQMVRDTDPVLKMKERIEALMKVDFANPSEEDVAEGVASLDALQDHCADLDLSKDFHKVGGFRLLVPLLASSEAKFRCGAAGLIGEMAQNNPYSQDELNRVDTLPVLLDMLETDECVKVREKALFATSSLIRENAATSKRFDELGGCERIVRGIQNSYESERFVTKAAFLLQRLAADADRQKDLRSMGVVEQLSALLEAVDGSNALALEHLLGALVALVGDSAKPDRPTLPPQLREFLLRHQAVCTDDEARTEELEHVNKLLNLWSLV